MTWETEVHYQVKSYKRLKKWYLMQLCLTLNVIRFRSRVEWSNPGKEVSLSPTHWCCSYRKRAFGLPLTTVANFTYFIHIYIYIIYIYLYIIIIFIIICIKLQGFLAHFCPHKTSISSWVFFFASFQLLFCVLSYPATSLWYLFSVGCHSLY